MILPVDDFILRALAAGLAVAAAAGPIGSFIVWRRMAYFGDTLAHSALLGVALGLLAGVSWLAGVAIVAVAVALLLAGLQRGGRLSADTILGILAHSSLSLGLVAVSFVPGARMDLMGYLFGDILAVSGRDLIWIYAGAGAALLGLLAMWRPLLATTVHAELAFVEGVPIGAIRLGFMLLIALVVAAAMKLVGALLITALLIIPAAAARRFACTPARMAGYAAGIGMAAVVLGLNASLHWDTPSGPSVVAAAAVLFLLSQAAGSLQRG